MRWMSVADDLTGAADLAGRLAGRGEGVWVARDAAALRGPAGSRVLDAETRFAAPARAAQRVRAAWAALQAPRGPFLRYQKIDSTLRGNPGEEIAGFVAATAAPWVAVLPAYPSQGRVLRQGRIWVHGVRLDRSEYAADPLSPSRAAGPAALFPASLSAHAPLGRVAAGLAPLRRWIRAARRRARFLSFDCVEAVHLERIARACLAEDGRHFAGAAEFGAALADAFDGPPRPAAPPRGLPWMVLAGSVSAATFAQLARLDPGQWVPLRRRGPGRAWRLLRAGEVPGLRRRLARQGTLALSSLASREDLRHWRLRQGGRGLRGAAVADAALRGLARTGLDVAGGVDRCGWFLTGGHSLAAFCDAAGLDRFEVQGQALPGVPLSRAEGPGGRAWLASKPGGFGGPGTLVDFMEGGAKWRRS